MSTVSTTDPNAEMTGGNQIMAHRNPYLKESEWGWAIDPLGLRISLNQIYDRFRLPVFVVENGFGAVDKVEPDGSIHDDYRIDYFRQHIQAIKDAVLLDGVNLIGYTPWGCIDVVSAGTGEMKKRYGAVSQGINIHIPEGSLLPVLWIGIINTGLGCFLYFSSISALPAQTVAICGYLEPLSAVMFSVIILRERMFPLQIIGAVCIDLATVIGVYAICNTGAVLVHAIDYGEDKALASINGEDAEWCDLTEQYMETSGELELGFSLGELFVPFCEVMRFYGGAN